MAVEAGFVREENVKLIIFVDGPADINEHEDYDWGTEIVRTLDEWKPTGWKGFGFDWTKVRDGVVTPLKAT